jgi:predicted lipoprotein
MLAIGCAIERAPAEKDDWLDTETAPDMLAVVGPEVVIPALDAYLAAAEGLAQTLETWDGTDGASRDVALDAFGEAVVAWQRVELMQLGPAASSLSSPIGEDLRDEVYSWPTVNPCRVDQVTAGRDWDDAAFQAENLVNAYGLDALEHLLTAEADNTCPSLVDINADGTWDALGDSGVAAHRAEFARALVAFTHADVSSLRDAWDPAGGDLSGGLAAGEAGPLGSEQAAINAIFDALFYLYSTTLHLKLEAPLGLRECGSDDCLEAVELRASGLSTEAVIANIEGFRSLFTGADSSGMDDLLVELGHGDLSEAILTDLDEAQTIAEGLGMPLDEAIPAKEAEVLALEAALKSVGDALKGDVATVLSLEVPAEAAGDND